MPYITKERRAQLAMGDTADTAGELNYEITQLLINYLLEKGISYQAFNDCLGALEGAKLELYRRKVVPYEDMKISYNGDVYK